MHDQLFEQRTKHYHAVMAELYGEQATIRKSLVEVFRMMRATSALVRQAMKLLRQVADILQDIDAAVLREEKMLDSMLKGTELELTQVVRLWRN